MSVVASETKQYDIAFYSTRTNNLISLWCHHFFLIFFSPILGPSKRFVDELNGP